MAVASKLHFHRFEFKYILAPKLRKTIESELNFFMELDPYVASKPHSQYIVRSLYYDDEQYSAYAAKIDGQLTRSKFRLRTYTMDPDEECVNFLEIKGRHDHMVFKHRSPLNQGEPVAWGSDHVDMTDEILKRTTEGKVLDQFQYDLYRKRIKPIMLIDYHRRPYISKYDPEFRVTFDDTLSATYTKQLHPHSKDAVRKFLPEWTVMEVKFRHHLPAWYHRIIESYELHAVSVSKICHGMEVHGIVEDL